MPDTNTPAPAGTGDATPLSEVQGRDALADILDDQATDTSEEPAPTAAQKNTSKAASPSDQGDGDVFDEGGEDDSSETPDDASEGGPARDESGRFVSPNAKVKLPDGTTAPVSELTKSYLRQSDYTRKAQDLAEQRKALEAVQQRVQQVDQQLIAQYQQVRQYLEVVKPQRPQTDPTQDPMAWLNYNQQKDQWDEWQRYWQAQFHQANQAKEKQQKEATQNYLRNESEALFKVVPALRDPGKRDQFVTEAAKHYGDIGIKREEIAGLTDHRMILILRDAVKWRRSQERKPAVKAEIEAKPQLIRGGKRDTPASRDQGKLRQLSDRLAETGSSSDGRAVLAHLIK